MVTLRKAARKVKAAKVVDLSNNVLDMSVTMGFRGANIVKSDILKLEWLLWEHCLVGVIAIERGDIENRLHFQMVC